MPVAPLPIDQELARGQVKALVSGFVPGMTPEDATYAVGVPVMVDGGVAYILSFTVPVSRLQGILAREVVQGWTTGMSDRNGIVLARLPDPAAVVGKPRLPSLRQKLTGTSGVWEGQDRQRRPVVVVEARSRLTGWTVATSIPQNLVDARVRRWIWAFAGFGLLVLATSSVLAVSLWARVTRPLRVLAASGPALARGEAIPPVPSPVHEIQRLGTVLSDASLRIRTRRRSATGRWPRRSAASPPSRRARPGSGIWPIQPRR